MLVMITCGVGGMREKMEFSLSAVTEDFTGDLRHGATRPNKM
jgi:hypothetical protein